eukprot:TRINITY_DN6158_c0_g2_i2.p1 TRINITY_DN6158_c0_g2~~TRINITY_DN6158_c0_g2_i2.p1  ORF type:complete len:182 (+),score=10.79 TRINITY_DN6158_c0_g2_i2:28-573(+)
MGPLGFLLLLSVYLSLLIHQPSSFAHGGSDLIHRTCKNTEYYDLCIASLASDPRSVRSDVEGLAVIIVNLAISNATNMTSDVSGLLKNSNDKVLLTLLSACADKYSDAVTALHASIYAMQSESYDYAYIDVSAAAEYPHTCHDMFKQHPHLRYPLELALVEDALEHLCGIALGIIDLLVEQ